MYLRPVCVIGSSNAVNIQTGNPTDNILKQTKLLNKALPGAEVNIKSKKSILQQLPEHDPLLQLVIWVGSNGVENSKFNIMVLQYHRMILQIFKKGFTANQINIILPMVRGSSIGLHWKQLFFIDVLSYRLQKYGIDTYNIYDMLPLDCRTVEKLFGQKDLKSKRYVHYSKEVRQVIHNILAKIIKQKCMSILNIDEIESQNSEDNT